MRKTISLLKENSFFFLFSFFFFLSSVCFNEHNTRMHVFVYVFVFAETGGIFKNKSRKLSYIKVMWNKMWIIHSKARVVTCMYVWTHSAQLITHQRELTFEKKVLKIWNNFTFVVEVVVVEVVVRGGGEGGVSNNKQ